MKVFFLFIIYGVLLVIAVGTWRIHDILKEHYQDSLPSLEEVRLVPSKEKRMYLFYKRRCKDQLGPEYVSEYVDCAGQYMTQWMEKEYDTNN